MKNNIDLSENEIFELIDSYEVISFDMFGTLVERMVPFPEDVFSIIEYQKKERGFRKTRTRAQHLANLEKGTPNLEEIYNYIPNSSRNDINEEIDIEIKICISNLRVKKYYEYAKSKGKKVIVISDMYLNKLQEEAILIKNEYFVDEIFTSSDMKATKRSGELFKVVIEKLGIHPHQMLHIGDDYENDYCNAGKNEIESIYVKTHHTTTSFEKIYNRLINRGFIHYSLNSLKKKYVESFYRSQIFGDGYSAERMNIGFSRVAIDIIGFCQLVHDYVKQNSIDKVYFMARDMYYVKKMYDVLFGEDDVKTYYLCISRKSIQNVNNHRMGLFNYLNSISFSGEVLVVDAGWRGEVIRRLEEFCRNESIEVSIRIGFWGAISKSNYLNSRLTLELYKKKGYLIQLIARFVETLLSETSGSCIGYDNINGTPILGCRYPCEDVEEVHYGLETFISYIANSYFPFFDFRHSTEIIDLYNSPNDMSVKALSRIRREDDMFVCNNINQPYITNMKNSVWKSAYLIENFPTIGRVLYKTYILSRTLQSFLRIGDF